MVAIGTFCVRIGILVPAVAIMVFSWTGEALGQSSKDASIENIYHGDYVNYTQIAIDFKGEIRCTVSRSGEDAVVIEIPNADAGRFGAGRSFASHAFSKMGFAKNAKTNTLYITIPVSKNVDVKNLHWHVWTDLLTLDLPLKEPNHTLIPSQRDIMLAKERGKKVVVIDPGHGGWNTNATGTKYCPRPHMHESHVVLDVGWRLYRLLKAHPGFLPVMTRYGDYLPVPFGAKGSNKSAYKGYALRERVILAREYLGDVFVSLHMNAGPGNSSTAKGYEIIHFGNYGITNLDSDRRNKDLEELEAIGIDTSSELSKLVTQWKLELFPEKSRSLSEAIAAQLNAVPGLSPRPKTIYASSRLRVLRHLNMPSVLVEMGFISHPADHELFRKNSTRDHVAARLTKALENFFYSNDAPSAPLIVVNAPDVIPGPAAGQRPAGQPDRGSPVPSADAGEIDSLLDVLSKEQTERQVVTALSQSERETAGPGPEIRTENQPAPKPKAPAPGPSKPAAPAASHHVVRAGESLGSIADLYGISVATLRRLNADAIGRRSVIHPGDELLLPGGASKAPAPAGNRAPANTKITYRVRPGDTLEKIASEFNTTVDAIKQLNGKKTALIYPNEKLTIERNTIEPGPGRDPGKPRFAAAPKQVTYKVRKGDSLWEIANKHNVSVSRLKQLNRLRSNSIQTGKVLRIPR